MDLEIRKFEESLIAHINYSKLPIEVVRLVVQEVCEKVTKAANEEVYSQKDREMQERQKDVADKEAEKNAESVQSEILGK